VLFRSPTCRAVCLSNPEDACENVILRELAKACNPELYARKKGQGESAEKDKELVLPMFIFNDPMFPGQVLRLHLFEQRYRLLARRAAESASRTFAYLCPPSRGSPGAGSVALLARIAEIDFLPDGRCLLTARLSSRHTLTEAWVEAGSGGLHCGKLVPLCDGLEESEESEACAALVAKALEEWRALPEGVIADLEARCGPQPRPEDVEAFSLWMASVACGAFGKRVELLACTDTLARLKAACGPFSRLASREAVSSARAPPVRVVVLLVCIFLLLTLSFLERRPVDALASLLARFLPGATEKAANAKEL